MSDNVRDIRDVLLGLHSSLVGTYLGDVCKRAADEIERLRSELAEVRTAGIELGKSLNDIIVLKDKRIAELEDELGLMYHACRTIEMNQEGTLVRVERNRITKDQINAAWASYMERQPTGAVLRELGIDVCEKCGGTSEVQFGTGYASDEGGEAWDVGPCDCPNNGWVMGER